MTRNRKMFTGFTRIIAFMLSFVLMMTALAAPVQAAAEDLKATPSRIPYTSLEETIDSYVDLYKKSTAAVSIVVVKDGENLVNKAYGFADIEQQKKADTSTVFEWGSVTKLLVWTSVMQLVEQGILDLDTDIQAYLPEGFLKKLKYDSPITLMNLMNHNAGWENSAVDFFYISPDRMMDLGDALQHIEPGQIYEPESVVAYSNFGAALAAYIVEVQSGQPFYQYVREHIFEPLKMNDTSIHPLQQDNPSVEQRRNEVTGYTTELKRVPFQRVYISIYPTGGAIGTAEDLAKFLAALIPVDGRTSLFAHKKTLDEMLSTSLYYDGTSIPRIAHGFFEQEYWVPVLEHGGNMPGFSSKLIFDSESRLGLVVMTNQSVEQVYCEELVRKVFGNNYSSSTVTSGNEGYYLPSRRIDSGFRKGAGLVLLKKYTTMDLSNFPNVMEREGKVQKASVTNVDYFPLSSFHSFLIIVSIVSTAVALILNLGVVIGYFIHLWYAKWKKRERVRTAFDRYHLGMSIAGLGFVINTVFLFIRTSNLVPNASLQIHLSLNLLYVLLAGVYPVMLVIKRRKNSYSRRQTVLYTLSGISAMLIAVFIVGWELYK